MLKTSIITTLIMSFLFFASCKEDKNMDDVENEIIDEQEEEEENQTPQDTTYYGAVNWLEGFPQVRVGTYSADILLTAEQFSKVYFLVTDKPVSFVSSEQLIAIAKTEDPIDTVSEVNKGVFSELLPEDTAKVAITTFVPETNYYAYAVAVNPNDSTIQESVFSKEFTLQERQQAFSYNSTAEDREVLYLAYQTDEGLKYPENKYPAIIFMGGNGEKANQGEFNLSRNGSLVQYIDKGNDIPMFVFSPQHVKNNWSTALIHEMVQEALENYPIDENRIYMTGISGGGIATWNYAVDFPDVLAAMIPISGDGRDNRACDIKDIPTWAFHNATDGIVSPSGSINMVNALNACDPAPETAPLLTIFEDAGHNAWRRVYDPTHNDWTKTDVAPVAIYDWFLQYEK